MKDYVFLKKSGNSLFIESFEGQNKSHIVELMGNYNNKRLSSLAHAFNNGNYSYIRDDQDDEAGVYYIITDESKALKQISDIDWISKVKLEANKYPKNKMHVIEYYRSVREGKQKTANKCKHRILSNYNFNPVKI